MTRALLSSCALVLCAWLCSCAHMHRDQDEGKPKVARLVVVVCLFSSCRDLVQCEPTPQPQPGAP